MDVVGEVVVSSGALFGQLALEGWEGKKNLQSLWHAIEPAHKSQDEPHRQSYMQTGTG